MRMAARLGMAVMSNVVDVVRPIDFCCESKWQPPWLSDVPKRRGHNA